MPNIVITGASRGIGRAISLQFAKNGWNVAFCSVNQHNVSAHLNELQKANPNANHLGVCCDVSDKDSLKAFSEQVQNTFQEIHVLVNNAGIFLPGSTFDEPEGTLEKVMATNLYSAYHITRQLAHYLIATKGHIFNICSVASIKAYPNGGSYSISKFALLGYTKAIREELKENGVKVTSVIPGATKTDSWSASELPDERFMAPEDIAQSIWDIYNLGPTTVVEEILLRPLPGDI